MENKKMAQKSIKISIMSLIIWLVLALILGSIALTQIHTMAQMNHKIYQLEQKVKQIEESHFTKS